MYRVVVKASDRQELIKLIRKRIPNAVVHEIEPNNHVPAGAIGAFISDPMETISGWGVTSTDRALACWARDTIVYNCPEMLLEFGDA